MEHPEKERFEITELYMAKAGRTGWDRCFLGTIRRERDSDDNDVVYGRIKVLDGFICTQAGNEEQLGNFLDSMVLMILDYGMHKDDGKTIKIFETDFFLN